MADSVHQQMFNALLAAGSFVGERMMQDADEETARLYDQITRAIRCANAAGTSSRAFPASNAEPRRLGFTG